MLKQKKYLTMDVQLLAEGGADGGENGVETESENTPSAENEALAKLEKERVKKNPLASVRYGVQEEEPLPVEELTEEISEEKTEDLEKTFEELIKGKYKDIYNSKVQGIVKDRLKNSKIAENDLKQVKSILDFFGNRYDISQDKMSFGEYAKKVSDAVMNDDKQYADEAMELGLTPEQLKKNRIAEIKAKETQEKLAELENEKAQQERFAKWHADEIKMREKYPSFNLVEELKNPAFASLMDNPYITMEGAYNAIHANERLSAAVAVSAKKAEEGISKKLAAKQNRPRENGVFSNSASITKTDVRNLTGKDIDEINRRVARGERITFSK